MEKIDMIWKIGVIALLVVLAVFLLDGIVCTGEECVRKIKIRRRKKKVRAHL